MSLINGNHFSCELEGLLTSFIFINYVHFRNEELSESFQNVLIEDLDELNNKKAAQDDPRLVTLIRQYLLEPGSVLPYNLTNNTRQDYSKGGQSTYVDGLLDHMENGFFVESGALDGERNSNSLLFERTRHWTGLLVEPNPYSYEKLKKKHRKAFSINACLSPHPYPAKLPMTFAKHPGRSYLNRYTPTHITRKKRNSEEVHLVQCLPLYSLLLASGRTHIQYFSLDIEGAEMSVLKTIPWDKVDIKVFQIERNRIKEGPEALVDFMATKGYKKLPFVVKPHGGQDTIFVKDGFEYNKPVV